MIKLFGFNGTDGVIGLEGNTTRIAEVCVPVTLKNFSVLLSLLLQTNT